MARGIGIVIIALIILFKGWWHAPLSFRGDDPYDKFLPKISSVIKKIFIFMFS